MQFIETHQKRSEIKTQLGTAAICCHLNVTGRTTGYLKKSFSIWKKLPVVRTTFG